MKETKTIGTITVDTDRCKGCGLCLVACPTGAVILTDKEVNHKGYRFAQANPSAQCNSCTSCAIVCPDGCITVYRAKSTLYE